jgi:predicted nucleic-acid-binding protein
MRSVDTNVLVRLLVRDDPVQADAAEAFVSGGAWVSQLVLAETTWVLTSVYSCGPRELAASLDRLLDHRDLVLQHSDVVEAALQTFRKRPAVSFSDCLIVETARRENHMPMGTFDRDLARLDGVERL